jgi:hypothetical protein
LQENNAMTDSVIMILFMFFYLFGSMSGAVFLVGAGHIILCRAIL